MMRNLIDTLQLRLAVRDHNKNHKTRVLNVMPSRVELDTIEAFRAVDAQANLQKRLRQAAQLEAFQVPDDMVNVLLKITGTGRITRDDINQIAAQGVALDLGTTYHETIRKTQRDIENTRRTVRLQHAVRRLARIAGPGFTTQHLIDERILHEGDI